MISWYLVWSFKIERSNRKLLRVWEMVETMGMDEFFTGTLHITHTP